MPRISQPPRSDFSDPEDLAAYDSVTDRLGKLFQTETIEPDLGAIDVGDYWGPLLNSPQLTALASLLGTFVRTAGERSNTYKHWERELVDQVLSKDWQTNVVQALHIPDAVSAGVRIEAIEAIRYEHEEDLNDDERILVRFIRAVVSGTVDDDLFAQIKERFGARGLVEYAGFVLWLQWIIRMMQLVGTNDPSEEEIDTLISGLRDGSVAVPDYRERIG